MVGSGNLRFENYCRNDNATIWAASKPYSRLRLLFPASLAVVGVVGGAHLQAHHDPLQPERLAQRIDEIALVVVGQRDELVAEQRESRRALGDLAHEARPRAPSFDDRRRVFLDHALEPAVELRRRKIGVPAVVHFDHRRHQIVELSALEGGDRREDDARPPSDYRLDHICFRKHISRGCKKNSITYTDASLKQNLMQLDVQNRNSWDSDGKH